MGRPSYDDETLAAYFYPMAPSLFADPVCGADLRRLAVADPDILAAVADVDRTQVRDATQAPPWQRFRRAVANFNGLAGLRPGGGFRQDSDDMLTGLQRAEVELVVVGAGAAMLLNVPILTENLAVVHRRTPDNVARLFSWLSGNGAHHRSSAAHRGLPPTQDALRGHDRLDLQTGLGKLDVHGALGEDEGYEELLSDTVVVESGAGPLLVLGLPRLIATKARDGGIQDRAVLPVLIATLDERRRNEC